MQTTKNLIHRNTNISMIINREIKDIFHENKIKDNIFSKPNINIFDQNNNMNDVNIIKHKIEEVNCEDEGAISESEDFCTDRYCFYLWQLCTMDLK